MEIANLPIRNTETCIVIGEQRVWGDVREDGKDKLVWEFKHYQSEME